MLSIVAIAHACSGCGGVLTRVRAIFDRAYGLPVVVCPGCGRAVVRRRHPISAALRLWWRRAWAAYGLTWRGAIAIAMIIGTAILDESLLDALRGAGFTIGSLGAHLARITPDDIAWGALGEQGGHVLLVMAACWSVLIGAVLSGGLAHLRRRWVPWAVFAGVMLLGIWSETAYVTWEWLAQGGGPSLWEQSNLDGKLLRASWSDAIGGRAGYAVQLMWTTGTLFLLMLFGIPIGAIARGAILRRDAKRFGRIRARVRQRRMHA